MYQCLNGAIPSRKCSIKAPAKWGNSVYVVLTDICHQRSKWLSPICMWYNYFCFSMKHQQDLYQLKICWVVIFYNEILIREVDLQYFFTSWKNSAQIYFSIQNLNVGLIFFKLIQGKTRDLPRVFQHMHWIEKKKYFSSLLQAFFPL